MKLVKFFFIFFLFYTLAAFVVVSIFPTYNYLTIKGLCISVSAGVMMFLYSIITGEKFEGILRKK